METSFENLAIENTSDLILLDSNAPKMDGNRGCRLKLTRVLKTPNYDANS